MNKSTKKNAKWNTLAIKILSEKYGVSKHYIRQCLRGDRNSPTSDSIIRDYSNICKDTDAITNKNMKIMVN